MNPLSIFTSFVATTTQEAGNPRKETRNLDFMITGNLDFMITDDRETVEESVPTTFLARRLDGPDNAYVDLPDVETASGGQGFYTEFANEWPFSRTSDGAALSSYRAVESMGGLAQS